MEIVDYQHGNSRLSIRKSHVCNKLMKIGLMMTLFSLGHILQENTDNEWSKEACNDY